MAKEEMAEEYANNIKLFALSCRLLSVKGKSHAYRLGRYDGFLAGFEAGKEKAKKEIVIKDEKVTYIPVEIKMWCNKPTKE